MRSRLSPAKACIILFFAAVLAAGLFTFDDHGISGDEIVNRNNGIVARGYAFGGDEDLLSSRDRHYGTFFEIPLVILEKAFALSDVREIFLFRHLATFLLYYAGIVFFYLAGKRIYGGVFIPLLGCVFFVLSPRIFSHAFYNSKDIAFMVFYIISTYTLLVFLEKRSIMRGIFHALSCAALIDVRVAGIAVPAMTVLLYALFCVTKKEPSRCGWRGVAAYLAMLPAFTVLFWPLLWNSPVKGMAEAFRQMARFPWKDNVLYLGSYVPAPALPWHYAPVWILITTPVMYSVLFFTGLLDNMSALRGGAAGYLRSRQGQFAAVLLFFAPLCTVISGGSVLYDGWRHMFFIYPAFLLVALSGVSAIKDRISSISLPAAKNAAGFLCILVLAGALVLTGSGMVRMHPYQNVYFNVLAGNRENIRNNFEVDYWGLSYAEALRYIASADERQRISVYISSLPGRIGSIPAFMLEKGERERFVFTDDPGQADYFVTNYRWHREDYPFDDEVYSITVDGMKILSVFKLSQDEGA